MRRGLKAQIGDDRSQFTVDIHFTATYSGVMHIDKELTAASSAPLVLSILAGEDSYGYAIIQRVHELSGGEIKWTDGMLYPVLHWLEDNGQIRGRWGKSETGRKRRYYTITRHGRDALKESQKQWKAVSSTLQKLWGFKYA